MIDLDYNNIRRLDGGLLIVFRELLRKRRTTDVARTMGLSQSAVSHALARLRDVFGDPLFIRRSHTLEPTRRAIELGPQIEALLELTASTLSGTDQFAPETSTRHFAIAWPETFAVIFGAALIRVLQRQAPNAAFASRDLLLEAALEGVLRGDVDLAIGQFAHIPTGLTANTLYTDQYCCVARKGHPHIKGLVSLESYANTGLIYFGLPASLRVVDPTYDRQQSDRAYGSIPDPNTVNVTAYVTSWPAALMMASQSDGIVDCPRRLAEQFALTLDLQILDLPYEAPQYDVQLIRRDGATDQGLDWLESRLFDIARGERPTSR